MKNMIEYETRRLLLRVLPKECSAMVLDFYMKNLELLKQWEPAYPPVFYTRGYQEYLLKCANELYEDGMGMSLWVFLKGKEGMPIGHVSVLDVVRRVYQSASVGYKTDPDFQGYGYATEALSKALEIAFGDMGLQRLYAKVMPENAASLRVLEKCGFEYEGVERSSMYIRDEWMDYQVYSLIRPDYYPPLIPDNN